MVRDKIFRNDNARERQWIICNENEFYQIGLQMLHRIETTASSLDICPFGNDKNVETFIQPGCEKLFFGYWQISPRNANTAIGIGKSQAIL